MPRSTPCPLDREGEIYSLLYNPDHRWFYVLEMRTDEAMLLKCYDSMRASLTRLNTTAAAAPSAAGGAGRGQAPAP